MTVTGPAVLVAPRVALAMGMAVHELTTNAVKFGSLSVPEGKVDVTWTVAEDIQPVANLCCSGANGMALRSLNRRDAVSA